jgi:hypothetical protein
MSSMISALVDFVSRQSLARHGVDSFAIDRVLADRLVKDCGGSKSRR